VFGGGKQRSLWSSRRMSGVAAALAASLASAETARAAESFPADRGAQVDEAEATARLPVGAVSEGLSARGYPLPAVARAPFAASLSPMQGALEAALERLVARGDQPNPLGAGDWRAARSAIAAFYAARDYAPVWVSEDGLTEAGRAALSQLSRASDDGLDLSQFALPHGLGRSLAVDQLAEAETTIASAVVTYAEQASGSRVAASRLWPLLRATPSVAEPGAALAETALASDPAQRLADFNPPQKGYRELREELKRLTEDASGRAGTHAGKPVDLQADQRRRVKGAAGARVAAASANAALEFGPFARKRAALLANMEMWRWEPRDMGERRIEVNVADYSVAVMEGDTIILQSRVIVGKPETPTPIFSNMMRYILINPSWQVPDSIIQKEMLPKLDYLSRHGYEVKTVGGRLTVRQLPGEFNALGRIAFMFPNDHSIYLHDTPARELFDEETRAFSHGCIRVEDPLSLAELVLGGEAKGWSAERIEAAFGGRERTVFLPQPLPVHIEYFTEFVDESGELRERPDVYGLTQRVAGMIAASSQD
jgi:L,D-transpeptidase YcbB